MGAILEARGNLTVVDIRYLNKENSDSWIDAQMRTFMYDAEVFNHTKMNGDLQPALLDLMMTNEALKKLLNQPWNANLPGHEHLTEQLKRIHDDDTPNPKKAKGMPTKEFETSAPFIKVTPKFEKIERISCEFCDKSYLSLKALEAHRKKEHPEQKFKKNLPKDKDQITCRTCKPHKKVNRDQIITHLKRVHKIVRLDGQELRGWETKDCGKTFYPAFRQVDEPDIITVEEDETPVSKKRLTKQKHFKKETENELQVDENQNKEKSPDLMEMEKVANAQLEGNESPTWDIEEPLDALPSYPTSIVDVFLGPPNLSHSSYGVEVAFAGLGDDKLGPGHDETKIIVEEKNAETDYHDSDSEEYTTKRREMKNKRCV